MFPSTGMNKECLEKRTKKERLRGKFVPLSENRKKRTPTAEQYMFLEINGNPTDFKKVNKKSDGEATKRE